MDGHRVLVLDLVGEKAMTEAELVAKVLFECGRHELLVHHCRDSRRCEGTPGVPDLIIASSNGVLFAELKGPAGETSADQDLWLWVLHEIIRKHIHGPLGYAVWRPKDWDSGLIQYRLQTLAA